MDPISQGALGAVAALAVAPKELTRKAVLIGWAGGMFPDLDIFIRSEADPLLNIEYHRQFTHSLLFIPIGGFICASLFFLLFGKLLKIPFKRIYLFTTAGYATAGLLDACTSYGTQLLWPFSNMRVAWNNISIIDPLFTLPLIIFIIIGLIKRRAAFGKIAAAFAVSYLLFGVVQRERAFALQADLIQTRSHTDAQRPTVKPAFANLILFRSIYQRDGYYYIDAIRVGLFGSPKIYPGKPIEVFDVAAFKNQLPPNSTLSSDIDRFAHFSDDSLARAPQGPKILGDVRYATVPNSDNPIWGIELDPSQPDRHAPFIEFHRVNPEQQQRYSAMLLGREVDSAE
ncbi:MAG: metal-dependent hydrolase [Verrucomicrobiota bacterium]